MVHTLVEAFVLVVIVVFLFLGNVRATLIPLIAVPVSLIGTFAVMLALGYSANTVSLLALVLAIGIVVDDAIVVVEAVEARAREGPFALAGRSGAARHEADHCADHRHHAGAAVGVRAGRVHPGHFGRAVPAVRGGGLGVDGHLGDQRADAVAGAVRGFLLKRSHGPKRGPIGYVLRGIDRARDGYAIVVRKLVRLAAFGLVALVVVLGGAGFLFKVTPTGFLPSEDQGAVFGEVQLPEGASVNRTEAVVKRVEEIARNAPGVANVTSVVGYSLLDGLNKSNSALLVMTLKPFDERKSAALSARRHHRPADGRVRGDPGGARVRLQPAADHRARHRLGLRIPAAQPGAARSPPTSRRSPAALVFAANQDPALNRVFTTYSASTPQLYLDIDREKAQTLGIDLADVFNALQSVLGS